MARVRMTQGRTGRIIVVIAFAAVLAVLGGVILLDKMNKHTPTIVTPDPSKSVITTKNTKMKPDTTNQNTTKTTTPSVDPSTLSTVDVEPLGVTVSYTKGTPGFEYTVLRAADSTQYAQFTSTDLIGTKCTDDQGVFASIIQNPAENDAQTIDQTVKAGQNTYGLSLASPSCTGDTELLTDYQDGFKNGFSSLKTL